MNPLNLFILSAGIIAFLVILYVLFTRFHSAEPDDFLQKHYDEDY